jgi:hypothetical protein
MEGSLTPDTEDRYGDLETLAALARDADLPRLASEAAALGERLRAGRFFVACIGQFKRGKSTVLNALVDDPVLPVGVTPVTSAITLLRYGAVRRATVFYAAGGNQAVPVEDIVQYVAEEHNHENQRGIAVVEVCLPASILARGLCLVDTPGISSTFAGNTQATRAFVPHIDAALVVLGADPPISGDELALVLDVLAQVPAAIFVLNKADRLSASDVKEAREFTERLIALRLGRAIGPVLEISAAERLQRGVPTRDWQTLEDAMARLTEDSADILRRSHQRGVARLVKRFRDEFDERRSALLRPIHESEARIDVLRRAVVEAEIMLRELGTRLAAEQGRLLGEFQRRQETFLESDLSSARQELHTRVRQMTSARLRDRSRAFEQASALARSRVQAWLERIEPDADVLYRDATRRFTALANEFLARLSALGDAAFSSLPESLDPEIGLREARHYYGTELIHLTAPGMVNRIADLVLPRYRRLARIEREAAAYLERLVRTNTTRVVFDLDHRVEASRRKLASELQFLLTQITSSAERALERARVHQLAGQEAVDREVAKVDALLRRLVRVGEHERAD